MANDAFNGTVIFFPTTSNTLGSGVRDASYSETGADVDLSVTTSTTGLKRPGITRKEFSVTVLGHATADNCQIGSTGTIVMDLGGDESLDCVDFVAYVGDRTQSGSMDGEVTTSFTFRPHAAS